MVLNVWEISYKTSLSLHPSKVAGVDSQMSSAVQWRKQIMQDVHIITLVATHQ